MTGRQTATDIARWAEARAGESSAISRAEQWQIVTASKRAGMTLDKLATEFGRSELEVGRVLAEWTDTTGAAKHLLKARALELADRMMTDADPSIALEILERLKVVDPPVKGGLGEPYTVQIGISADLVTLHAPEPRPLSARDTDTL